jgi:hypothetical protein
LFALLAVDDSHKGWGFGEGPLINALAKLLAANDSVAFLVVIVDVKYGENSFRCITDFNNFKK